ncbi:MAG: thioredoxin domain-containing protein [bacterium]
MDTANKKTLTARIIIFALIIIAIVVLMRVVVRATKTAGTYDNFAQCLVTNGTKFYGAFWCPHCQQQEQWLDASRQKLANEGLYTECSTADTRGQTQVCIDKGIQSYPTWIYKDGTRDVGEQSLAKLSQKTGCALPGAAAANASDTSGASLGGTTSSSAVTK